MAGITQKTGKNCFILIVVPQVRAKMREKGKQETKIIKNKEANKQTKT